VNPAIFREYDIRGVAERDFDVAFAASLGRAFGTLCGEAGKRRVSVGRDCRVTSDRYAAALSDGIRSTGLDVVDIGVCPTPCMYFTLFEWKVDGGVQVTGSHNPADYNGFKVCLGKEALYGAQIQDLRQRIQAGRYRDGAGATEVRPVVPVYQDYVVENVGRFARPIDVVVDAGNGTAGPVAPAIYRRLGARVTELFTDMDGRFPNHHPDPTVAENVQQLIAKVRETRAELGIAFDGDGDRIGAVDERGTPVFGDQLLVLFGRDLARRFGPGKPVIFDVKCSEVLPQMLLRAGLVPLMWKTGHSLIRQKMKESGAALAGEMSGHIFFGGDWYGFDDALFAAARLLHYVAREGGPLSRLLADLPKTVATPELRVDCPDERKFAVVERAARHFAAKYRVSTLDGVRITFAEGWGLLRASNTQPALVMRFEATSDQALAAYRAEVEGWLAANTAPV